MLTDLFDAMSDSNGNPTEQEIELYSTDEDAVLDREFALKCKALVPPSRDEATATADFAAFLDSLVKS